MNQRETARLHALYVDLKDRARMARQYAGDADKRNLFRQRNEFTAAADAYEYAAERIHNIFLGKEETDGGETEDAVILPAGR